MADTVKVIDEGTIIEVVQGGSLTVVQIVESGLEIEKLLFTQLSDTPSDYKGQGGKTVTVKEDESGLEFSKTYNSFISLTDTPNKYDGAANQLVAVNQNGNGLRFINYVVGDLDIEYFTQLGDVPQNYTGKGNYIVTVKKEEDGLAFSEPDILIPSQSDVNPGSYKYPQIVVNEKGIITAIQEGKPFEFDHFEENKFLIGDGTSYPKQFDNGALKQYLTTASGAPSWAYISELTQDGRTILKVSDNGTEDTSQLNLIATKTQIRLQPVDNQEVILGKGTNILTLNGYEVQIPQNVKVNAKGGLTINPNEGTVGIGTTVNKDDYATRISDNDFITKHWFDINQREVQVSLVKSSSELLLGQPITFSFPSGAVITEVNLQIMSPYNDEVTIQITDTNSQILYNSEDCPILDEGNLRVFLNQPVYDPQYKIIVTPSGYVQGQGNLFVSYFTASE